MAVVVAVQRHTCQYRLTPTEGNVCRYFGKGVVIGLRSVRESAQSWCVPVPRPTTRVFWCTTADPGGLCADSAITLKGAVVRAIMR